MERWRRSEAGSTGRRKQTGKGREDKDEEEEEKYEVSSCQCRKRKKSRGRRVCEAGITGRQTNRKRKRRLQEISTGKEGQEGG